MKGRALAAVMTLAGAVAVHTSHAPLRAQSVLDRTPNMQAAWIGSTGNYHLNVIHRFNHSGAPERQVNNRATLLLAWSPVSPLLAGVHWSSRSALVPGIANEWEPFVRAAMETTAGRAGVQVGWNAAARSVDAELSLARGLGPLRLLVAARGLSADADKSGFVPVAAGGAVVRVTDHLAFGGDAVRIVRGETRTAWGAAVQLRIPASPHSLSLHAANTDGPSLHASSRGSPRVRWGFEFTVAINPARYRGGRTGLASASEAVLPGDSVVHVRMHNLRFTPDTLRVPAGTVIVWQNEDPLPHTVTAADGSWDSGDIPPGGAWRRRFTEPGTVHITCAPHPFMHAVVVVTP